MLEVTYTIKLPDGHTAQLTRAQCVQLLNELKSALPEPTPAYNPLVDWNKRFGVAVAGVAQNGEAHAHG